MLIILEELVESKMGRTNLVPGEKVLGAKFCKEVAPRFIRMLLLFAQMLTLFKLIDAPLGEVNVDCGLISGVGSRGEDVLVLVGR